MTKMAAAQPSAAMHSSGNCQEAKFRIVMITVFSIFFADIVVFAIQSVIYSECRGAKSASGPRQAQAMGRVP
ncbi:hypothetical protein CQ12_38830 [Bradyrhizobium jicamae]|uniref:Uncharacterized protein n=1 Tax=Bradyrhizobium jicamae TaxID=280332 RepID=A0A0R3LPC8_9BRAD|nr:hypothetical protein CQ12_38830 [Bradyrhizobium jicamae]